MSAARLGHVALVGAGPGDPELITLKGLKLLQRAEVVLYDRLAPPELLDAAPPDALRIDVGKHPGRPRPSQPWINGLIVEHALAGRRVVRLKGGDPYVFGRGAEEALAAIEAGIPVEVVPGVSAGVAVPAAAGVPVTHRGVARAVAFVTAVTDWDHPANTAGEEPQVDAVAHVDTICLFMGLAALEQVARRLIELGRAPQTPALSISRGCRPEQREVAGTLADIAERVRAAELESPVMTVIGDVVGLREKLRAGADTGAGTDADADADSDSDTAPDAVADPVAAPDTDPDGDRTKAHQRFIRAQAATESDARPPLLLCLGFDSPDALHRTDAALDDTAERLALSTCQRHELYLVTARWPELPAGAQLLAQQHDAAARLFAIAAGALSDVPGERAVARQVRQALRAGCRSGTCGPRLTRLAQAALQAGSALREKVAGATPILELADLVALEIAAVAGDGRAPHIALLGAGALARSVERALRRGGTPVRWWATRRPRHGRGPSLGLDEVRALLGRCDVVIGALAGAPGAIDRAALAPDALAIDLGVPANVQGPALTAAAIIERQGARLAPQADAVRRAAHRLPAQAASAWAAIVSPSIAPVARSIVSFRETIVEAELRRLEPLLAAMDPADADRVRRALRHTAARSLHPLHDYVSSLGRQGRAGEAATIVDHLLGSRVGFADAGGADADSAAPSPPEPDRHHAPEPRAR